MILSSFLRAVQQLTDPRFMGVLAMGVGLTIALFAAFYFVLVTVVGWFIPDSFSLPLLGEITWADAAFAWASVPLMLLLSSFLMVPVASVFISLFLDTIADAVESRHYPYLPRARQIGMGETLVDGLKFLGLLIGVNLVAFIGYILAPPLAPFLFWAVNGILLGREYVQLVVLRRQSLPEAAAFRRRHRGTIFLAGVMMAVPLTVPIINLLVPILGAATYTHIVHRLSDARA